MDRRSCVSPPWAARWVGPRGVAVATLLAIALSWPMLFVGGPLLFPDSAIYVAQGERVVIVMGELAHLLGVALQEAAVGGVASPGSAFPGDGTTAAGGVFGVAQGPIATAAREAVAIRSLPYALFAYATYALAGLAAPAITQTIIVVFMAGVLIDGERQAPRGMQIGALAIVALVTAAPWYAAYLMPDLLAAAVLLYAMILVRGFDALSLVQRLVLGLLAAFAIVCHYGHIPLAAGAVAAALLARAVARRPLIAAAVAGAAPILLAMAANLVVGVVALKQSSATPGRFPIMLARSIEDGPALWHLRARCPEFRYAVCDYFGEEIPTNVATVLWRDGGLSSAPRETLRRIREEEFLILRRAFAEYPAAQSWSLARNAVLQIFQVGLPPMFVGEVVRGADGRLTGRRGETPPTRFFDHLAQLAVLAGAMAIALCAWRDGLRWRDERALVFVLVAGLAVNAVVFGGLSAPVDRYQGRIAWLIPALALLFWLARRVRPDAASAPPPAQRF
jgi:hypothetical protein